MTAYVSIARRFALAEKEELRDPDYFSYFRSEPDGVYKWLDLFEMTPLIILGEGRSGKTREFKEQIKLLHKSGNFALFIPLERLHDEDFESALSKKDLEAFVAWTKSPTANAYFFLDALDELKLRNGSLRTAVKKIQLACAPHFARMKLVVSCRPADWQSQIDSQHLESFCVAQNSTQPALGAFEFPEDAQLSASLRTFTKGDSRNVLVRAFAGFKRIFALFASDNISLKDRTSQAFFLEVVSKSEAVQGQSTSPQKAEDADTKRSPTIVTLLPLSQNEIREFARSYAPDYADTFYAQLEKDDFWHLYRLPAEIINALDQLATDVSLGTLEDQLRLGIQRKLRDEQPNKRRALSIENAQKGAERIALALFLLKRRTLKIEESGDPDTLDIADVLTDWTPDEQQELIGKTLFDPSGIGSVRFHHRASQEYLAAMRLDKMRKDGMHERDLFALLFSEVGGEEVVKPSMAPVAAWLALWHPDIRRILLERQPSLLFCQGLPSALSMDIRAEVLRANIHQYAGKGWCQTGIGHDELSRVAHPNLGVVVRELWEEAYTGHNSLELLLEMIWLAPMPDCTNLSLAAALDGTLDTNPRLYASRGVLTAGTADQKLALAAAVLNKALPQRVIRNILSEMVPSLIPADAFLPLVDDLDDIPNSVHGLKYTIYQVVNNKEFSDEEQINLRDLLAEAIWGTRRADCRMYQTHSEKDHYQDGLIACCNATIPTGDVDLSAWGWALTVAVHFGDRQNSDVAEKETKAIWSALDASTKLREAYFWACLDFADKLEGQEDDWHRFICFVSESRRSILCNDEDQHWLLSSVEPEAQENRRGIAFQALLYFFDLQQDAELADTVEARIADREDWLEKLRNVRNAQPRLPAEREIKSEKRSSERKAKDEKRVADWLEWRNKVLGAPDFMMDGDKRLGVLYDANEIINQGISRDSTWGNWDSSIIARALGNRFLDRYRQELSIFWRATDVQLWSERTAEERNSYPRSWLLALSAVKSEAETIGWATSLSHDEAVRAARIACIELNGFSGYMATLNEVHPQAVADVVAGEAFVQLQQLGDVGQAEMFQDVLYHGTKNMKAAVATRVAPHISEFLSAEQESAKNALEYAIRIIAEGRTSDSCSLAITWVGQQLEQDSRLPTDFVLLLFVALDPEAGCLRLLRKTEDLSTEESRENAINAFAKVFGDRHSQRGPDLVTIPEDRRIPLLKDLVLHAYQAVRPDEDVEHEGAYTPDLRDNAQDARSFLLDSLLNTKLPETLAAIHELAEQPEFAHMPDRLRQMAYEIAADMSDINAHPLTAFQTLDRDGAFVPFDDISLLTAMMTRLDSFEHDVLHSEDTPVEALRKLDQETDLRCSITNWLRGRDRGIFDFPQEAVVIREKRPDIRFVPKAMKAYGTVELKRETWTIREFEKALNTQLVGQYLQNERCRVGCLLICMAKQRYWKHPVTNKRMILHEVVSHLNGKASEIMASRPELHIVVKGIDYSEV